MNTRIDILEYNNAFKGRMPSTVYNMTTHLAKRVLILLLFCVGLVLTSTAAFASCVDPAEIFIDGVGCFKPSIVSDQKIYTESDSKIASSLGDVSPIQISNPWAAAGQPVIVEFTLENNGDELGYPFNQIPLASDQFVLQVAVDKDIGIILADGRKIDIWSEMSGFQKVMTTLSLGTAQAWQNIWSRTIRGKTCSYVEITAHIPKSVQELIDKRAGATGTKAYAWNCLRIAPQSTWQSEIKSICPEGIDDACIADMNRKLGRSVSDTLQVLLVSEKSSGIKKGQCKQEGFGPDIFASVKCSIGDGGLQPGQKVTFTFVALVPADTPVISTEGMDELLDSGIVEGIDENTDTTSLNVGFTTSASCLDSPRPEACHSVYAAVYPSSHDNIIKALADGVYTVFGIGTCTLSKIWSLGESDITTCVRSMSGQASVVGEPLWQGQGIFFVVGPSLKAYITLILMGALAAGMFTGFGTRTW